MAAFHIHALAGITVGMVSQGNPAGYPLALLSHAPLDDLNSGVFSWNHSYSTGWLNKLYILFTVMVTAIVLWKLYHSPYLIPYAICACLPDAEHPIRWLRKKRGYWIHTYMSWAGFQGEWGIIMWVLMATLAVLVIL